MQYSCKAQRKSGFGDKNWPYKLISDEVTTPLIPPIAL